ncbi:Cutinase [Lasiodiplodia theobromae]|uniref:Cutinase n=1 Tax=Lasiodiplodia theobromae TaxID=45133 RepID=A0A5N5DQT2_9PEZI|nr:Cutinase [Lasiodiplodia theobromae]
MKSTTALLAATLSSLTLLTTSSPVPAPSPQLSLGGTQNGVTSGTATCKPVTLIFARGTFELSNMGSVVGPSLASDLGKAIGTEKLTVQGVNYAADVAGIFAEITGGAGTAAMLAEAKQALSKCPQTQLVLSGYSQGAMLVHNTIGKMQAAEKERIVAAVTFGDPFKSVKLDGVGAERFKTFCATVMRKSADDFTSC